MVIAQNYNSGLLLDSQGLCSFARCLAPRRATCT